MQVVKDMIALITSTATEGTKLAQRNDTVELGSAPMMRHVCTVLEHTHSFSTSLILADRG